MEDDRKGCMSTGVTTDSRRQLPHRNRGVGLAPAPEQTYEQNQAPLLSKRYLLLI